MTIGILVAGAVILCALILVAVSYRDDPNSKIRRDIRRLMARDHDFMNRRPD